MRRFPVGKGYIEKLDCVAGCICRPQADQMGQRHGSCSVYRSSPYHGDFQSDDFSMCAQGSQQAAATALWLVAACQTIGPMFSFSVDCKLFCKAWNLPEMLLQGAYLLLVILTYLLGPHYLVQNHLGLNAYAYRWQSFLVNISGAVAFSTLLPLTRMVISRIQRKVVAIQPDPQRQLTA